MQNIINSGLDIDKGISSIAQRTFGEGASTAIKSFVAKISVASRELRSDNPDLMFAEELTDDALLLINKEATGNEILARGRIAMLYTTISQAVGDKTPASTNISNDIMKKVSQSLNAVGRQVEAVSKKSTPEVADERITPRLCVYNSGVFAY